MIIDLIDSEDATVMSYTHVGECEHVRRAMK